MLLPLAAASDQCDSGPGPGCQSFARKLHRPNGVQRGSGSRMSEHKFAPSQSDKINFFSCHTKSLNIDEHFEPVALAQDAERSGSRFLLKMVRHAGNRRFSNNGHNGRMAMEGDIKMKRNEWQTDSWSVARQQTCRN